MSRTGVGLELRVGQRNTVAIVELRERGRRGLGVAERCLKALRRAIDWVDTFVDSGVSVGAMDEGGLERVGLAAEPEVSLL